MMEIISDTRPEIAALQRSLLRQAGPARKLAMLGQMNQTVRTLALSGLRSRYPDDFPLKCCAAAWQTWFLGRCWPAWFTARWLKRAEMLLEPIQVTLKVVTTLERLGIPYLIGGSLASVVHGIVRATMDAYLVADVKPAQVSALVASLGGEFYIDAEMILDAIQHYLQFIPSSQGSNKA